MNACDQGRKPKMKTWLSGTALVAATLMAFSTPAQARDAYLGEVFVFAGNFCPRNTLPADGRLLAIDQNTALFSLLGTMYGGDGRTTFALPKLDGTGDKEGRKLKYCIVTQGIYPARS
jgi:microcystin-dependent protein